MSIKWTSYLWENATDTEGTHLLVLLSIADHSGDDGTSFPSVKRLASRARCDERTVQRALAEAESLGWLERTMRPGRSTVYQLLTPDTGVTPDKMSPPTPVSPHPRHPRHPSGDMDVTPVVTPMSPITVREPPVNPGGGGEVTTEGHPTSGTAFPGFAKAALAATATTPEEQGAWMTAWLTIAGQDDGTLDPTLHLTRYLARCKSKAHKRTPNPDEWVAWYVEDYQREQRERITAAAKAEPPTPTNSYWE